MSFSFSTRRNSPGRLHGSRAIIYAERLRVEQIRAEQLRTERLCVERLRTVAEQKRNRPLKTTHANGRKWRHNIGAITFAP